MLLFPMLAASLVVATLPEKSSSPLERSLLPVAADVAAGDSRDAKHVARGAAKLGGVARPSSHDRILAPGAVEPPDPDQAGPVPVPARATRESGYVCPTDMAMIGRSYCVDLYEASLVQVMPDGTERDWPYYQVLPRDVIARAVSLPGVYPQGYVSGEQARSACERSGKRLCSPGEWRSACMGPRKTTFPYGNQRETGRCNDNGRSAMHFFNPQLDGKPEHRWMWGAGGNMIDPRLNQLEGTLTRTGERSECTNEYGVFDMVGNLHEWVDDPDGTFQGGYYLDTHLNGDGCNYRTTAHPMSHYDYSTGFRCCADVAGM